MCRHVGIAWPPATALGVHHNRQSLSCRQVEQTINLLVVIEALRTGKDAIVVDYDCGSRGSFAEPICIDGSDTCYNPVARGIRPKIIDLPALTLSGHRELAVLRERSGSRYSRD